jgi:hypothetical protein
MNEIIVRLNALVDKWFDKVTLVHTFADGIVFFSQHDGQDASYHAEMGFKDEHGNVLIAVRKNFSSTVTNGRLDQDLSSIMDKLDVIEHHLDANYKLEDDE